MRNELGAVVIDAIAIRAICVSNMCTTFGGDLRFDDQINMRA